MNNLNPLNNLPIQAHILAKSLGKKKICWKISPDDPNKPHRTPRLGRKASICPQNKNVVPVYEKIYTLGSYINNSQALKYSPCQT